MDMSRNHLLIHLRNTFLAGLAGIVFYIYKPILKNLRERNPLNSQETKTLWNN